MENFENLELKWKNGFQRIISRTYAHLFRKLRAPAVFVAFHCWFVLALKKRFYWNLLHARH